MALKHAVKHNYTRQELCDEVFNLFVRIVVQFDDNEFHNRLLSLKTRITHIKQLCDVEFSYLINKASDS